MLDFRFETFLTLCQLRNYTKTAARLHITQPAVTQHIQHLERHYSCKLFNNKGKALSLTAGGKRLYDFALTMRADAEKIRISLLEEEQEEHALCFGATLSIGEYVLPPILAEMLQGNPRLQPTMYVGNTKTLLAMLDAGKIDFAFLEGIFDKREYHSQMFSRERFVPVCGASSSLAGRTVEFEELLEHRLILREKGSGTREIFEQILVENNMRLSHFSRICEVGNMSAIKQLVAGNTGVTFLYHVAARAELDSGRLRLIDIDGMNTVREFNFVFLKNSLHENEYQECFARFRDIRHRMMGNLSHEYAPLFRKNESL